MALLDHYIVQEQITVQWFACYLQTIWRLFFPEIYSNEHFQVDINIDVLIILSIMLAKKWCLMPSLSAKSVRNVMILSLKTQNKILVRCNPCTKTWRDNCELTLFHPFYRHHKEIIIKKTETKKKTSWSLLMCTLNVAVDL